MQRDRVHALPAEHPLRGGTALKPPLPDGPFLVVGLARSGIAAALALRERGERVTGADSGSPDARRLSEAGVEVHERTSGAELVAGVRTVVKSPGVPSGAPAIVAARATGRTVIGELELAWRLLDNPFIAVTGTNGKTTTSELLGHLFRRAGRPVAVAGNVGTAASSLVGTLDPRATVVCEASSFQLEDAVALRPEVGVLLNVTEDHLDRHGTLDAYREAKLRVFARQTPEDVAVAPCDFPNALPGAARRACFGDGPQAAIAERGGRLWWGGEALVACDELALRGAHNRQNAMAAAAAALSWGLDADAVAAGLRDFPGVEHRLEPVAVAGGVEWVNDSKATNPASTAVALRSFAPGSVHVILGGRAKGGGFAELRAPVAERCRAAYLIGEAAGAIEHDLAGAGVPLVSARDLDSAVGAARAAARPGDVVLLSPACASFDQYPDYEARGEHFRALATAP